MNELKFKCGYKEASAGTGKTHWIVKEKLHELKDAGYELPKILIVTFTEKATGELRNRIREEFADENVDEMHIFTIHSFCQRVLDDYAVHTGSPSGLTLVDANKDASAFVDRWIRDVFPKSEHFKNLNTDDFNKSIRDLKNGLTKALEIYDPTIEIRQPEIIDDWYVGLMSSELKNLYCDWQKDKAGRKVQTYNDMITSVHTALHDGSPLLGDLQKRYDGAIIDEFQDTNQLQWDIFRKLFKDDNHFLFVVGDPKQSIYAFQGADVNVYNAAKADLQNRDSKELRNFRSADSLIASSNKLFEGDFFNSNESGITFCPSNNKKGDALEKCGSVWSPGNIVNEYEFAEYAVHCIRKCCNDYCLPDNTRIRYSDFAILARTTSEMKPIEQQLRKSGIPYVRYKDRNLFKGLECQSWISLLRAVDSVDFSGHRRRILNEALYTRFFDVDLDKVDDSKFDSLEDPYRKLLLEWHLLAKDKKWTELVESILEKSGVEKRLAEEDKIDSISRFRQIGNYILEYVFETGCSLDDACRHLSDCAESSAEDDGALVERGTDRDCVRIMTIHASKGLEFPIVISVAGFKGSNPNIPKVFPFHEGGQRYIGFDTESKEKYRKEEKLEWRRLFYVAFTRAKNLLIIPRYEKWEKDKDYGFLRDSVNRLMEGIENQYCMGKDDGLVEKSKQKSDDSPDNKAESYNQSDCDKQQSAMKEVYSGSKLMSTFKHSYSSLSHPKTSKTERPEGEFGDEREHDLPQTSDSLAKYDSQALSFAFGKTDAETQEGEDDFYPRGAKLGTAVHEVFEKAVFSTIESAGLDDLISSCFRKQAIRLDDEGKIIEKTKSIVENTLNAVLPTIHGSKAVDECFRLCSLSEAQKKSEVEFFLNPQEQALLKAYCNGFVDLIFERDGYYSVLDWKTDTAGSDGSNLDYSSFESLKGRTDEAYSIQRVLYSYCLIKWLKQFDAYHSMTEQQIFEEHFGGIYYAYVRGCIAGRRDGIYAQSWRSWNDLEEAFKLIRTEKMRIFPNAKGGKNNVK